MVVRSEIKIWCGPWEIVLPRGIVGFSFLIERGIVGFWPPLQETIDDRPSGQTMGRDPKRKGKGDEIGRKPEAAVWLPKTGCCCLVSRERERERHRPATGDEGSSIPSIQMDKTKKKKKESKHRIFHAPVHMRGF